MIIVLFLLSLLLISIGYIVTEKNAKNLLSGYNTMTEQERKEFDLKSFIQAFRKFHLFLGVSLFILGTIFSLLISEAAAVFCMVVYPIMAYIWFMFVSRKYYQGKTNKWNNVGIGILVITLIGMVVLMIVSTRESKMLISPGEISISGLYGEKIKVSEIVTICMADSLPSISMRTNGFAMGGIRKGYFKTTSGEKVKLILNSTEGQFLVLTKKTGDRIYFSSGNQQIQSTFTEIQSILPDKTCK